MHCLRECGCINLSNMSVLSFALASGSYSDFYLNCVNLFVGSVLTFLNMYFTLVSLNSMYNFIRIDRARS